MADESSEKPAPPDSKQSAPAGPPQRRLVTAPLIIAALLAFATAMLRRQTAREYPQASLGTRERE